MSSASSVLHSVPAHTSMSTMPPPSDPNFRPATSWTPTPLSFPGHPVMPGTPGNPAPPGLASASVISSNPAAPPTSTDSPSAAPLRPNMPAAGIVSDPTAPQKGTPYLSVPAMLAPPPQGFWLQPPQMSGVLRPPFLQYPPAFPGPFPFPARGVTLPAVPVPDSQPPGVTPVSATGATSAPSASSHQLRGATGLQTEVVSGHAGMHTAILPLHSCISSLMCFELLAFVVHVVVDDKKKSNATQNEDAADDQLDAWTAHKTEARVVYYYNALTGESTYDKPAGFKGEVRILAAYSSS